MTWGGGTNQQVTAFQPLWGFTNNENNYFAMGCQRKIAGVNDSLYNCTVVMENWAPNDGVVIRVIAQGGNPPAGTTTTVDYICWATA